MTTLKKTPVENAVKAIRQRVLLSLARVHGVSPSKIEERMARPSPKYNDLRIAFYNLVDRAITTLLTTEGVFVLPGHWSAVIGTKGERAAASVQIPPVKGALVSYWTGVSA